ncbi:SEC23-interacting protein [Linum perenne]
MYADRVEASEKLSVKERLNGSSLGDSSRRRQVTGKRQRQDDKWEHDLYNTEQRTSKDRRIDAQDLRLKLQKKTAAPESGRRGVRDLREKLSGTMNPQPVNADPPKAKPAPRRTVAVEATEPEVKKVTVGARKKAQQKENASVDSFLQSLGLEKYVITFQAEEVDMTALLHMTDDDLKAMGVPMGPRKKILLALESKV